MDKEFLAFLAKKVGPDALKSLQSNHYEQLQYIVQKFCKNVKLKFTGNKNDYVPYKMHLDCPAIKEYITEPYKEELTKGEWIITFTYDDVKLMFDPIIDRIIKLIREQLYSIDPCFAMVLVGGFSQSQYLQTCIGEEFRPMIKHISVPDQPLVARCTSKSRIRISNTSKLRKPNKLFS